MKILFVNLSTLRFNVATPDTEPLGGSESCVCYLARQLAKNGHDVTLVARLPENSAGAAMGVAHHPPPIIQDGEFFAAGQFDIVIACNAPVACPHLRAISPKSLIILWDHVPPDQPSMRELSNPEVLQSIDLIVYVSEWQKSETEKRFGINKKSAVIGNGLTPAFENMFGSAQELRAAKENRAAYTTIPYRGLPVLLKVMENLEQDMKLDIFSSMRVYQMADDEYAALYREAAKDPRITSHGAVSQTELGKRLKPAAFLAYPSVCAETFCIAALEAMAAGMKVISTRLGALETTTMGYADLIPVETSSPDDLATAFKNALGKNIIEFREHPDAWAEKMFEQVQSVNRACTWTVRAGDWERIFTNKV